MQEESKKNGPLVWMDLEMTGLDIANDVILEVATIITDGNLTVIAQGPVCVIHQSERRLAAMNEWCQKHHTQSGLVDAVRTSTSTIEFAQATTLRFIQEHCEPQTAVLCGNSIWQDRLFLARHMPDVVNYLHYRMVDVSSFKNIIRRWYPHDKHTEFKKTDTHRAYTDIQESIAELKHYRKYFFV
jgi:oligoribonuclease